MWIKAQESRCCDQTKDKWDQDARIPMAAMDDSYLAYLAYTQDYQAHNIPILLHTTFNEMMMEPFRV